MAAILLLGADKRRISAIGSLLRQDRHTVYLLRDVRLWREADSARDFDLIVAAIGSSERIMTTGDRWAAGFATPLLIVQEGPGIPKATQGDDRVVDRISIPFTTEVLLARVDALVRMRRAVRSMRSECGIDDDGPRVAPESPLRRFGNQVSSLLNARVTGFTRPRAPYVGVATRVAAWADRRDAFEPGHAERVAAFSALIADGIGLSEDETTTTVRAARLHDLGKIALPIEIIRQRYPLAEDQKRLLQTHPERGATILGSLDADASTVDAVRHHHARFDRTRHDPMAAGKVPLPARIIAVAEVFDAMTTSLVLPALPKDAALERVRGLRGGQLDPVCVDALIEALKPRPAKIRVAPRSS